MRQSDHFHNDLTALLRQDRATIEADQRRRLLKALADARQVPFYKDRLGHMTPEQALERFDTLTPLDRQEIKTHHDELFNPAAEHDAYLDSTGGSTGSPTPFWRTRTHKAFTDAVDKMTNGWIGGGRGRRTLVLWGAQMDTGRLLMNPRRKFMFAVRGGNWIVDCFKMDKAHCEHLLRLINWLRPHVIRGYRSILVELGRHIQRHGGLWHRPTGILSASELLLPEQRAFISGTLGAPVFDRYGSREMGLAAAECHKGSMHVLDPSVYVEVVSPHGINKPGQEGHLLVTSLNNSAAPLIRYRIGDRARWHGHVCDCGLPLPVISMTQGREGAMVHLPNGESLYLIFFHQHLRLFNSIRGWQLVQRTPDHLEMRLAPANEIPAEVITEVRETFQRYFDGVCTFEVSPVASLERNRTGKVELYIRGDASAAQAL